MHARTCVCSIYLWAAAPLLTSCPSSYIYIVLPLYFCVNSDHAESGSPFRAITHRVQCPLFVVKPSNLHILSPPSPSPFRGTAADSWCPQTGLDWRLAEETCCCGDHTCTGSPRIVPMIQQTYERIKKAVDTAHRQRRSISEGSDP